jgi:hypothetical protein
VASQELESLLSIAKSADTIATVIAKSTYTPQRMVTLIIENPNFTHAQYGQHFGRTAGWFAAILANVVFQEELAKRASEVSDPTLTASMEERLRGLAMRSLTVLQRKLDSNEVADFTVLKAAEIGIKGLGLGNPQQQTVPTQAGSVDALAERLVAALERQRSNVKTVDMVIVDAELVTEKEI